MNRLSVVCIGVKDLQKSLAFYKSLGFTTNEQNEAPPVVFFNNGGARLELLPLQALIEDIGLDAAMGSKPPPSFGAFTLAYNVRTKAEVGQAIELARRAGARILKEPQDAFWGGHHGYFADPDGAVWEVVWAEGFTFDENDLPVF